MDQRARAEELIPQALELLAGVPAHVWDHESLPVPIADIADSHLGLLVREVDDMAAAPGLPAVPDDSRISGLLLPEKREIWVNAFEAERWPYRRRYTIAHEIGHWVLHRDAANSLRCRAGDVKSDVVVGATGNAVGSTFDPDRDLTEWEANVYGGALLLPPPLLRRHWDGDPDTLPAVSELFEVSLSAMSPRTESLRAFGGRAQLHYEFE